ncbi:MAG: rRNA pseudouridine synthase [Oligoflexia bacterium]|nr:rRNA pseudouridine synthase [Oligoflexia bacterium]
MRLQKFIADCVVASRRHAEDLIRLGDVTVNGRRITEMGVKVIPGKDAVKVSGKLLRSPSKHVYIALHKPTGVVTTLSDPEERTTIKDLLVGVKERVFPVGRLDYDSEGLILLTNDGELAQQVAHPKSEIRKVYKIKLKGKLSPEKMLRLRQGVTIAEGRSRVKHIEKLKTGAQHDWYKVVLTEGRHNQLRRMFIKVGCDILKIQRVAIGRLTLGGLDRGKYKILTKDHAYLILKD